MQKNTISSSSKKIQNYIILPFFQNVFSLKRSLKYKYECYALLTCLLIMTLSCVTSLLKNFLQTKKYHHK